MGWAILGVIAMIGMGVMMLAFPDAYRAWHKFGNDWEGVKTEQGPTFEAGRMIGGVVLIVAGIILMIMLLSLS